VSSLAFYALASFVLIFDRNYSGICPLF
jgi:hypothetical protein